MKIITTGRGPSPFGTAEAAAAATDLYGAFSIRDFADGSAPLPQTHGDAQGWLDYLAQFQPANFWYTDTAVQSWAYGETWDNWQDTFGLDAVNAVYHSGHGGMLSRNLLYTAVTRARTACVLVGQRAALARAVGRADAFRRNSRLAGLLTG